MKELVFVNGNMLNEIFVVLKSKCSFWYRLIGFEGGVYILG